MRHVSRTHRVALEWLFDSINLEKLVDILPKGSFTRDEWDLLLPLLKIITFSMFSCSHFLLSNRKAECHVNESSRKYVQRRFDSDKTETNEFGVKISRECEDPLQDSSDFHSPDESGIESELCFIQRQETDAKPQPKPNNVFSREATR